MGVSGPSLLIESTDSMMYAGYIICAPDLYISAIFIYLPIYLVIFTACAIYV